MTDVKYHSPESIKAGSLPFVRKEFSDAIAQGRVCGVTVSFGEGIGAERAGNCITIMHDSAHLVQGTLAQTDRWDSEEAMIKTLTGEPDNTHTFDAAMRAFFLTANVTATFLRVLEPADIPSYPIFNFEFKYWVQLMRLSIKSGPFWFYTTQDLFNKLAPPGSHPASWYRTTLSGVNRRGSPRPTDGLKLRL